MLVKNFSHIYKSRCVLFLYIFFLYYSLHYTEYEKISPIELFVLYVLVHSTNKTRDSPLHLYTKKTVQTPHQTEATYIKNKQKKNIQKKYKKNIKFPILYLSHILISVLLIIKILYFIFLFLKTYTRYLVYDFILDFHVYWIFSNHNNIAIIYCYHF